MEIKRRKFQGVLNILSFNRHFYIVGFIALALLMASHLLFSWPNFLYWIAIAAFTYGLTMPLLVSAYVYDFSGYYNFHWLKSCHLENAHTQQVVNINAGFDETSFILEKLFPQAHLKVFDFYNATRHTEPAIIRARKVSLVYPGTQQIISGSIPLPDQSADIIFLLSAVHEIRTQAEKVLFLKECRRVCKPSAPVIMVEHLRDLPNFLAFTIGFTHFFSKKTWRRAFNKAGFCSFTEIKFTPFLSIFQCIP